MRRRQVLAEHEAIALHSDLVDCHVDVCSPEVSKTGANLGLDSHFLAGRLGRGPILLRRTPPL